MRFIDRAVGIDLGTTHSEIALLDPSERDLVIWADRYGRKTMPSAVGWDPATETFVVGRAARAQRGRTPPPIESIKRKMGQDVTVEVGPHRLRPEEVSAKILAELVRAMAEDLGKRAPEGTEVRLTRAVITVPAYFDAPQVQATRQAGELAGLEVIGVLQEPTAAALYAQWKHRLGDGHRLVYDLGGGTFDVSVLRAIGSEHRVLSIDGDNYLGGDDFDRRFAEVLRKKLSERGYALDLNPAASEDDRLRFQRLTQLAQEAKEQLSSSEVVHLSREAFLVDQRGEPVDVDLEVSRAEHEAAIADLVEATLGRAELALARAKEVAGVEIADIDHVLLVGGSTRLPLVERRVTEALASRTSAQRPPLASEVDTSVALGAALYAASLGGLRFGEEGCSFDSLAALSTKNDALRLVLRMAERPVRAGQVAIERSGTELSRAELSDDVAAPLTFVVPFEGDADTSELSVVVLDAEGDRLAALPLTVWRADVGPRPSALSRAAVVAKDIGIEVARGGRTERKVLIARGATLPAKVSAELFTGDRTGTVVLRLYSGLLPIQTLALEVPQELPVGTAVSLDLSMSETMALEAKASIAGRELWSKIEPARARATPEREHIESLLATGGRLESELWGHRRTVFGWSFGPLAAGLRETVTNDPDRTRALAAQLEQLLEEAGAADGEGLRPPWDHFAGTLDAIRRIAYRGTLLGENAASWEARLKALEARGHEAQRGVDAVGWRTVNHEAQALHETALSQAHAAIDVNDPAYVRLRHLSARRHAEEVAQRIAELVLPSAPEVRALQAREQERLRAELQKEGLEALAQLDWETETPSSIRRRIEQVSAALDRIEAGLDRLPTLGLVTDRKR